MRCYVILYRQYRYEILIGFAILIINYSIYIIRKPKFCPFFDTTPRVSTPNCVVSSDAIHSGPGFLAQCGCFAVRTTTMTLNFSIVGVVLTYIMTIKFL